MLEIFAFKKQLRTSLLIGGGGSQNWSFERKTRNPLMCLNNIFVTDD
ncbi:Pyridoxal-5'-phosphate-dependent enzyme, beta subunit [Yersinia kristensenii ATCC 33638]|nr:Pyridoxal-5'-phosphate-dependent enzyme, beta subunit [Yersinia kristensenii ATCC 33638]